MDFFWSLPKSSSLGMEEQLRTLFTAAQARRYEAGTLLSDPGATPQRAFFCSGGTLKVTKMLSNGREILITILEPGSIWSDRSLLKGYWREVYVESMSPASVSSIEKDVFEHFICENPDRLTGFMAKVSEQMSDALTLLERTRRQER
jgi:CRP-like cAMP-binding protein